MTEHDATVLLLRWKDGSHAVFFESDKTALQNFINRKVERDGPEAARYLQSRLSKREYDLLKGL